MKRGRGEIGSVVRDAFQAVGELADMEVQKKPEREAAEPEIGEKLSGMDGEEFLDGFEFNDDAVLGQNVEAIASFYGDAFVEDRHQFLADVSDVAESELVGIRSVIGRLEETGAEFAMDFNRSANEFVGKIVEGFRRHGVGGCF